MPILNPAKADILAKIWHVISEHGLDLTLEEFAIAVQVDPDHLVATFQERSQLFVDLVVWRNQDKQMSTRLMACIKEKNPEQRTHKTLSLWCSFIPDIYPIARELLRMNDIDRDAANAWKHPSKALRDVFFALAQSLERDEALGDDWDAERAADYMWVMAAASTWATFVLAAKWPHDAAARAITKTIMTALLKPEFQTLKF